MGCIRKCRTHEDDLSADGGNGVEGHGVAEVNDDADVDDSRDACVDEDNDLGDEVRAASLAVELRCGKHQRWVKHSREVALTKKNKDSVDLDLEVEEDVEDDDQRPAAALDDGESSVGRRLGNGARNREDAAKCEHGHENGKGAGLLHLEKSGVA